MFADADPLCRAWILPLPARLLPVVADDLPDTLVAPLLAACRGRAYETRTMDTSATTATTAQHDLPSTSAKGTFSNKTSTSCVPAPIHTSNINREAPCETSGEKHTSQTSVLPTSSTRLPRSSHRRIATSHRRTSVDSLNGILDPEQRLAVPHNHHIHVVRADHNAVQPTMAAQTRQSRRDPSTVPPRSIAALAPMPRTPCTTMSAHDRRGRPLSLRFRTIAARRRSPSTTVSIASQQQLSLADRVALFSVDSSTPDTALLTPHTTPFSMSMSTSTSPSATTDSKLDDVPFASIAVDRIGNTDSGTDYNGDVNTEDEVSNLDGSSSTSLQVDANEPSPLLLRGVSLPATSAQHRADMRLAVPNGSSVSSSAAVLATGNGGEPLTPRTYCMLDSDASNMFRPNENDLVDSAEWASLLDVLSRCTNPPCVSCNVVHHDAAAAVAAARAAMCADKDASSGSMIHERKRKDSAWDSTSQTFTSMQLAAAAEQHEFDPMTMRDDNNNNDVDSNIDNNSNDDDNNDTSSRNNGNNSGSYEDDASYDGGNGENVDLEHISKQVRHDVGLDEPTSVTTTNDTTMANAATIASHTRSRRHHGKRGGHRRKKARSRRGSHSH